MDAFAPAEQPYLLVARQMQALSFAVHIPLVCFGIAFPAMVLFVEWRFLRSGDPLYRTLARRWSKIMIALFAVGVVTGTILSFELGLLWPGFVAAFGSVFGLAFALEGFSFFLEAIFIAIYVYGWDRLPPRLHCLSGLPAVVAGMTGSLFVISVNGWMNHPGGFVLAHGAVVDARPWTALFENAFFWHELVHMYVAGYVVAGFLLAMGRPRRRPSSAREARRHGRPHAHHDRRPRAPARLVRRREGRVRHRHPAPAVAARFPRSERDGAGP
jgi:cytochrome bd ubiquinol oxidase subunit I